MKDIKIVGAIIKKNWENYAKINIKLVSANKIL